MTKIPNYGEQDSVELDEFVIYSDTFRIAKLSDINQLKKIAKEHWGVEACDTMSLYDETGEQLDTFIGRERRVEKIVDIVISKDSKWKEIPQEGLKQATFFLGL